MKSHPPQTKKETLKKITEHFIDNAETILPTVEVFPWKSEKVRSDIKKMFILRLPEAEFLMLQYLQKKTNKSMQKICLDILLPAIHQEIEKITGDKS